MVAPGADAGVVGLALEGADKVNLDNEGNLVLHTNGSEVALKAPTIYQVVDGVRQQISGSYVIKGKDQAAFQLVAYDIAKPLIAPRRARR